MHARACTTYTFTHSTQCTAVPGAYFLLIPVLQEKLQRIVPVLAVLITIVFCVRTFVPSKTLHFAIEHSVLAGDGRRAPPHFTSFFAVSCSSAPSKKNRCARAELQVKAQTHAQTCQQLIRCTSNLDVFVRSVVHLQPASPAVARTLCVCQSCHLVVVVTLRSVCLAVLGWAGRWAGFSCLNQTIAISFALCD